jgi:glutathione synthase/RimK-type ligase-like ATP-grasp enzyme
MTEHPSGARVNRSRPQIAFATSADYADLTQDDQRVVQAGETLGLKIHPAVWNDASVVWTDFDAVVIRSCWDYHHQPESFLAWVKGLEEQGVALWNPPSVIRWNSDKRYLLDLQAWGIPAVPTLYLPHGTASVLTDLLTGKGWSDAIVKPAISASAFNTWRTTVATASSEQARFAEQVRHSPTLIQPYVSEITAGEWSLIYFNGHYSHAALKRPQPGDFRVQGEFGGHSSLSYPGDPLIQQAAEIIAMVQSRLEREFLYIRVDGVVRGQQLIIMELELIEPSLFIAFDEGAAARFAHAIRAKVEADGFLSARIKAQ